MIDCCRCTPSFPTREGQWRRVGFPRRESHKEVEYKVEMLLISLPPCPACSHTAAAVWLRVLGLRAQCGDESGEGAVGTECQSIFVGGREQVTSQWSPKGLMLPCARQEQFEAASLCFAGDLQVSSQNTAAGRLRDLQRSREMMKKKNQEDNGG